MQGETKDQTGFDAGSGFGSGAGLGSAVSSQQSRDSQSVDRQTADSGQRHQDHLAIFNSSPSLYFRRSLFC